MINDLVRYERVPFFIAVTRKVFTKDGFNGSFSRFDVWNHVVLMKAFSNKRWFKHLKIFLVVWKHQDTTEPDVVKRQARSLTISKVGTAHETCLDPCALCDVSPGAIRSVWGLATNFRAWMGNTGRGSVQAQNDLFQPLLYEGVGLNPPATNNDYWDEKWMWPQKLNNCMKN